MATGTSETTPHRFPSRLHDKRLFGDPILNLHRFSFVIALLCLFISTSVSAAPLDKAANKKIDEAINVHYLGTDFDKAVAVLEGTVEACGAKCSDSVLARAYMYMGIVKGAGLGDNAGAEEAFATALSLDPEVKLDKDLATDELVESFESAGGDASKSAAPPSTEVAAPDVSSDGLTCTPDVLEIQVRRPIAVTCRGSQPATKAVVHYKEFGAPSYTQIPLALTGSDWLATIPCSATALQGELAWYVVTSGSGGPVETYGSEGEPNVLQIVATTTEPPPNHPGKPAPAVCADVEDCPEEMRGTPTCPNVEAPTSRGDKAWGAGCKQHQECEQGLFCLSGSCESPPSCETGADCNSGICEDFLCKIFEDEDPGGGASGDGPENFLSVGFGLDLSSISGDYVCNPYPTARQADGSDIPLAEPSGFTCFVGGQEYYSNPYSNAANSGSVPSTLATGTMRVFLSYEHVFAGHFGAEVQAGVAFNGSPKSGIGQLIHAAGFGKYWFTGTGEGLKLYGALGGGLGQVDANESIAVLEEGEQVNPSPVGQDVNNPASGAYRSQWYAYCPNNTPPCPITPVQAYKSLGQGFIGLGLGAMYNLGSIAFDIRLLGKYMVPASGVVLQPTGSVVLPF